MNNEKFLELRTKLKSWEASFADKHGRKPGWEDIRRRPVIASEYKIYHRLSDSMKKAAKANVEKSAATNQQHIPTREKSLGPRKDEKITPTSKEYHQSPAQKSSHADSTLDRILSPRSLRKKTNEPKSVLVSQQPIKFKENPVDATTPPESQRQSPPQQSFAVETNSRGGGLSFSPEGQSLLTSIKVSPLSIHNHISDSSPNPNMQSCFVRPGQFAMSTIGSVSKGYQFKIVQPQNGPTEEANPFYFTHKDAESMLDSSKESSSNASESKVHAPNKTDSATNSLKLNAAVQNELLDVYDDVLDNFLRQSEVKIKKARPANQIVEAISIRKKRKQETQSAACASPRSSEELDMLLNQAEAIAPVKPRANYIRATVGHGAPFQKSGSWRLKRHKRILPMKRIPVEEQDILVEDDKDVYTTIEDELDASQFIEKIKPKAIVGESKDDLMEVKYHNLLSLLQTFGYPSYRRGQEEAINLLLQRKSVLLQLPTGAGKSLVYQMPAFVFPGITIVISPLISLMQDQVNRLPSFLPGVCITASTTSGELTHIVNNANAGDLKIIFVSPERITSRSFLKLLGLLPKIDLVCIDEAHCMSEWSHNFRTSYLRLPIFIREVIKPSCLLALTATATAKTLASIASSLSISKENILCHGIVRENIKLNIIHAQKKKECLLKLLCATEFAPPAPIIVYCTRQYTCDELAKFLQDNGFKSSSYHSGRGPRDRSYAQRMFLANKINILVATIAFGMGIDKPDIRGIIHYDMPRSLENYVQETGRSGRDGAPAICYALLNTRDYIDLHSLSHSDLLDYAQLRELVDWLKLRQKTKTGVATIPISTIEQSIGIKEEVLSTILCFLEAESVLSILSVDFATYRLRFYKTHPDAVAAADSRISRILQLAKKTSDAFIFDIIDAAYALQMDVLELQSFLKEAQAKHDIRFDTSDQSFHVRIENSQHLDSVVGTLYAKLQGIEKVSLSKLNACFELLSSCGTDAISDETSSNRDCLIWQGLSSYFLQESEKDVETPSGIFEEDVFVDGDIRVLLSGNLDFFKSGRAVTRIMHGISSPHALAKDWSRNPFWGKYRHIQFEHLENTASDLLVALRAQRQEQHPST